MIHRESVRIYMSHLEHQKKAEKTDSHMDTGGQKTGNGWSGLLSREAVAPCKLSVVLYRVEQEGGVTVPS